nr:type VII secretion integral membrane protein EccD [Mycolicibacterium komanii]CRL75309.1 type VII secretion integral membrane protein EccD [Mycolicibacterium komanii]
MPDSLCRVSVHVDDVRAPTVDLALPNRVCVCDMLPSIIDLTRADRRDRAARWRLHRVDGSSLDESLSLLDNNIRDGELLWLSTENVPAPVFVDRDAGGAVARLRPTHDGVPLALCVGGSVVAAGIGGIAILSSGRGDAVLAGAAVTAAAVTAALVARRIVPEPLLCTAFSVLATVSAAVTGAVVVPAGALAAHLLLASAAALAAAVVGLRITGRGDIPLTAIASASLLCTGVTAASVAWHLDGIGSSVLLATVALVTVSSSPRLAIKLTRVGSEPPQEHHAARAHDLLTGMLSGASTAAVIATVFVGYGAMTAREFSIPAAAFDGVVGAALLLRTRTHIGTARRTALGVCGFGALAAGFAILAAAMPGSAHWLGAMAAVAGTGCLLPFVSIRPGLVARRAAELAEYAALAAVIPLGCWIAGLFGLVRGLALA